MSNTEFTPGPWEVRSDSPYSTHGFVIFRGRGEKNKTIARFHYGNSVGFGEPKDRYYLELKANVNLMSSAPDMYEALSEILTAVALIDAPLDKNILTIITLCERAIVKAEGME